MTIFVKDPDAVLDFAIDWSTWLASSETVSTSTVTVSSGLIKDSDSESGGVVTVWLSGGTAGQAYAVTSQIVTNQGRTDDRTIQVRVCER